MFLSIGSKNACLQSSLLLYKRKEKNTSRCWRITSWCVWAQEGSLASNLLDTDQQPVLWTGPFWGCFLSLWMDPTPGLVRNGAHTVGSRERTLWPEPRRESVERRAQEAADSEVHPHKQPRGGWERRKMSYCGQDPSRPPERSLARQESAGGGGWPTLLGSTGPWCLLEWQPWSGPPDTDRLMEGVPWERRLLTRINVPGPGVQYWGSLLLQNSESSKSKSVPGLRGERAESPRKSKPAVAWEYGLCCGKSQAGASKPKDRNVPVPAMPRQDTHHTNSPSSNRRSVIHP